MRISSRKVKSLMGAHLMTQQTLADVAGVSRATINAVLLKGSCSAQTVRKVAHALNVSPAEIVDQEV